MREHDPEIEELRAKVHCAVVLERTPPTWKLDRKESRKLSLKYCRILIVSPPGSARFAHRNDAGAVTHVDIRGPAYKGSPTGGAKSLFRLPPEGPALPRLVVAEASIDALSVAAIENVRADTLYAATRGDMGPGTTAALISASIATCPQHAEHLAVLEHDCVPGRQALGDAAGFIHAAAGRAAPQESRGRHARPLATPMGAHSPIATTLAQWAILRPKLWERLRMMNDARQYAPATLRNRDFILGILRDVLPTRGVVL